MFVADIMTAKVVTVGVEANLAELRATFELVNFRHLLVQQQGKLLGVISDRDVARALSPFLETEQERELDRQLLSRNVAEIMSKNLITVDEETLIDSASILLIENNISCLPVVDELSHIRGIVSWKDILQFHVYGVDTTVSA
ncbi:CBS domain-containing protein [Agaribacterium haliotis]|uniref:CBS domain-containing protein n=1 Tax=Agaribacterium haliotis TaxID=2013869 RepID=UPI000BB57696|nr:CBS domain-containing protein [Agaribacterium haliotis]